MGRDARGLDMRINLFGYELVIQKVNGGMVYIPLKEYKSMKRMLRVMRLRT